MSNGPAQARWRLILEWGGWVGLVSLRLNWTYWGPNGCALVGDGSWCPFSGSSEPVFRSPEHAIGLNDRNKTRCPNEPARLEEADDCRLLYAVGNKFSGGILLPTREGELLVSVSERERFEFEDGVYVMFRRLFGLNRSWDWCVLGGAVWVLHGSLLLLP